MARARLSSPRLNRSQAKSHVTCTTHTATHCNQVKQAKPSRLRLGVKCFSHSEQLHWHLMRVQLARHWRRRHARKGGPARPESALDSKRSRALHFPRPSCFSSSAAGGTKHTPLMAGLPTASQLALAACCTPGNSGQRQPSYQSSRCWTLGPPRVNSPPRRAPIGLRRSNVACIGAGGVRMGWPQPSQSQAGYSRARSSS